MLNPFKCIFFVLILTRSGSYVEILGSKMLKMGLLIFQKCFRMAIFPLFFGLKFSNNKKK